MRGLSRACIFSAGQGSCPCFVLLYCLGKGTEQSLSACFTVLGEVKLEGSVMGECHAYPPRSSGTTYIRSACTHLNGLELMLADTNRGISQK